MGNVRQVCAALGTVVLGVSLLGPAGPAFADDTTGSVSGHLSTAGTPRTGVSVTLYTADGNFVDGAGTDPTGAFHIANVAPGRYQVQFDLGNGLAQRYHGRTLDQPGDLVTVNAGQDTDVEDETLPTGTVAGTLTDHAGNPVAGALAFAYSATGAWQSSAVTDPAGHYAITVLSGGYRVSFRPQGYQDDYVPHTTSAEQATVFTVPAGGTLTVDEDLPAAGTIHGRYTTADGLPVAGASVEFDAADGTIAGFATADADGHYQSQHLYAGGYRIGFFAPGSNRFQWAFGKLTQADADTVIVTADSDTEASDSEVPTGSVAVTAKDAVTGRGIPDFCAGADGQEACSNGTGTALVTNVRRGTQTVDVSTSDGHYFGVNDLSVTVSGGATAAVTASLRPGATTTTVVLDAATGQPVPNACLAVVSGPGAVLPDGLPYCSDVQGTVHIGPLGSGSYAIYVGPPAPYGAQWVGPSGGVGSVDRARRTTVKVPQTVAVPAVRLDHAGTIAGTVTDASGHPVSDALVGISPPSAGVGSTGPGTVTDSDGHYTFTALGPYAWPLFFTANGQASQWSGGVADRGRARAVRVTADATVTFDAALVAGVTVSGTVRAGNGTPAGAGFLSFYNAGGGDPIGLTQVQTDGTYRVPLLGSQDVKAQYVPFDAQSTQPVWIGGADFAHARKFAVGRRDQTLDLALR